jgi:phosphate transport system ATP-binding protein
VEGRKLKGMFGSQAKTEAEEGRNTMTQAGPVTETSNTPSEAATSRRAKTLEAKEVNLYYGDFHAVEGVNMTIEPNKVTALIGSSGCGKTTFLRSLNRMHELTPGASVKGNIELDGEDIYGGGVDPVAVRRLIGMVFQQPNPFPTMSIYDNVAAGLNFNAGRVSKSDKDAIVEKSLRGAHLWDEVKDRLDKPGSGLSGGQQQRLCIARATAVSPEVLLMDEPCSALDPVATLAIEDLIGELKKEFTIAIVTHNMQQASRASDITAFFNLDESGKPGHLVEIGPTEEIFTKPKKKETEDYVSGRFG